MDWGSERLIGRSRARLWVGLALLAASMAVAACSADLVHRAAVSLRVPLRFDREDRVAGRLTPGFSGPYSVYVDLRRSLPMERLEPLMVNPYNADRTRSILGHELPVVTWTIVAPPGVAVNHDTRVRYFGETVGYEIGRFHAEAGHTYTIGARTQHPDAAYQVVSPRIIVRMGAAAHAELMGEAGAFLLLAIAVGFAGGVLLRLALRGRLAATATPPSP